MFLHGLVQKGPIYGDIKYKRAFLIQPVFSGTEGKITNFKLASRKLTKRQVEAIQTCLSLLLYTPQSGLGYLTPT